jgi:hypothetical protein
MAGLICEAIQRRLLLELDYDGLHRVVQPYAHGRSTAGREVLRAIQVGGQSRSARIASGKLWSVEKLTGLQSKRYRAGNHPLPHLTTQAVR